MDRFSDHEKYYRFLKRNIVLIVVLVSLTPMVILTGIILYRYHETYYKLSVNHLELLVEKHRSQIDTFLNDKLADIELLGAWFTLDELSVEPFLEKKLQELQEKFSGVFVDLGVIDQTGLQLAYAGPFKLTKANYAHADWFRRAIDSSTFISDVFLGIRGLPHFIVAVRHESQGRRWLLRATIDFVAFNSLVENIHIGRTGLAFILNSRGELQTHTRFTFPIPGAIVRDILSHESIGENVSIFQRSTETGKETLYVTAPLKDGEWILVYQQDVGDFFSGLATTRNTAIMIFIIACAFIISAAVLISRRMVKRIQRVDQEKEMMNEQVIEAGKLASLGELAAGIAHEINNPVAIMVEEAGWIEDLLQEEDFKQGANLEEFERALRQIRTQGSRCKDITHKLLSFARKTDPTKHDVAVNELIREVVSLSEQRAKYASVAVDVNLDESLPQVSVSPSELQQVLLNLINNALDAMDSKGGKLEITSREEDGYVVIDVADTGPGIPQANLQRIFDPFYTTKPVGKGTGLGLSICYGIIKKMNGVITVNSAAGVGAAFHVKVPFKGEPTANGTAKEAPGGGV